MVVSDKTSCLDAECKEQETKRWSDTAEQVRCLEAKYKEREIGRWRRNRS